MSSTTQQVSGRPSRKRAGAAHQASPAADGRRIGEITVSPSVQKALCNMEELVELVASVAVELDPDIDLPNLWVRVEKGDGNGYASRATISYVRGRKRVHPAGCVFVTYQSEHRFVRSLAHCIRHIGQFARQGPPERASQGKAARETYWGDPDVLDARRFANAVCEKLGHAPEPAPSRSLNAEARSFFLQIREESDCSRYVMPYVFQNDSSLALTEAFVRRYRAAYGQLPAGEETPDAYFRHVIEALLRELLEQRETEWPDSYAELPRMSRYSSSAFCSLKRFEELGCDARHGQSN